MSKEGGELVLLLGCSLISSYFMSFHCSLLWPLVVSSRAGLGWKVSSRRISHAGIPFHVPQDGSRALLASVQPFLAGFALPSSLFQRGAGPERGQTSTKAEFSLFSQLDFSVKPNWTFLARLGSQFNNQVCIFSAEIENLKKLWAPEPLLEGFFLCSHPFADLVNHQVWV